MARIIPNDIIPFKGFSAINLFGVVFVRNAWYKKARKSTIKNTLNHEAIHTAQQKELLYVGFYLLYLLEWLFRLVFHTDSAYRGISFEREAYAHAREEDYLAQRRHYAMWRRNVKK